MLRGLTIGESISFVRRASVLYAVVAILLLSAANLRAVNVYQVNNDAFGDTGFTSQFNDAPANTQFEWSDGLAAHSGANYVVAPFDFRTPSTGSPTTPSTFVGDSLTIVNNGRILWKGADQEVVTINNFTLDAANIRNAQGLSWTLASNSILVGPNGMIIWDGNGGNNNGISGPMSGTGVVALGGNDATGANAYTTILSGANTYTGPTYLLGGTTQLGSNAATAANNAPNALPANAILRFGSATPFAGNGNGTLNLNGGNYSVAGLSVATFAAVTATGTATLTVGTTPGNLPSGNRVTVSFPTLPPGIQVGQAVAPTAGGVANFVTTIDYATNTIGIGDNANGFTTLNSPISISFLATNPTPGSQVITNTNTANPATLTFAGIPGSSSTFDGLINQAAGASTRLTVVSGSLTIQRSGSSYTGTTTTSGGTLTLNFNSAGSPQTNIVQATSPLVLAGGTLALNGTTSATTTTNTQTFAGATIGGSSALQLTANFQGGNPLNPRNQIALVLGGLTRSNGTLDVTQPAGTQATANSIRTTTGTANNLIMDASGAAYVTVAGLDWGVKDSTNAWIVKLPSYTASTATTLAGNADVVTNVALAGPTTVTTMRFNSGSQTVSGSTLSTGGILMTAGAGASAINGGTLQGTAGAGSNLTLIQYNTANSLSIGSVIADNGAATALNKTGAGTVILSGANTYTGATNALGGTLQFAKQNSLPGLGVNPLTVNNGASLAVNVGGAGEFTATGGSGNGDVGTLAGLAGFQSGSLLGIDTSNAGGAVTLSGIIANPNSGANAIGISKLGSGTLILGAANTYTGTTNVRGGILQLGVANAISTSSPVSISGGTLDMNNTATTLQSVAGGGGTLALGSGDLTIGGGVATTYSGAVTGSGGVIIRNSSTQSLAGTPSYTGSTTVVNGSLSLSTTASSTVGSGTSSVTIGGADSTNPATVVINTASGNLTVGNNVNLVADQILIGTVDAAGTDGGVGTLTMTGGTTTANALYLGGNGGTYTQGSSLPVPVRGNLQLNGGTLTVPAVQAAGGTRASIRFSGGTLQATAGGADPTNFVDQTNIPNIAVQAGGATIDTNGHSFTMTNNFVHDAFAPVIDGGFNKAGTGTLTLSGANTFTGFTAASGGTLIVGTANAATAGYAANGASAIVDVSGLTAPLSLTSSQSLRGIGTILGAGAGFNHTAGIISGGVSSSLSSTGTLTLSGGALQLSGGTVRFDLQNSSALSNDKIIESVGLSAPGAAIVDVEFTSQPAGNDTYTLFQYAGAALSASDQANFALVGNGGRGVTLDFATAGLVKLNFTPIPSGTLIWNSSSDPTWIAESTQTVPGHKNWHNTTPETLHDLFVNSDSVTFDDTGTVTGVTISGTVVPSSVTVTTSTNSYTLSGTGKISGAGAFTKNGSSTLTIATNNDYQGATTINSTGKIIAANTGGTASLSATGTGPVTVGASATLQIGNGVAGAGTVLGTIHDNGSVVFNRPAGDDITISNAIDGTGSVTLQGGDTITSTGTLTYSGLTNLASGTLKAGAANTLPLNSTVVMAAGTTVDLSGFASSVGALSGGAGGGNVNASANITFSGGSGTNTYLGTFTASGATTQTIVANGNTSMVQNLSGTISSFLGATTVNNGTLNYSPSGATTLGNPSGGSAINVGTATGNNGTLGIGASVTLNVSTMTIGANNGTNGIGTLNSAGTIQVFGPGGTSTAPSINIGNNGGVGTLNLTGGSMLVSGNVGMSGSGATAASTINVGSGASMTILSNANVPGNIVIGNFFNPPATINMNGGNLSFTDAVLSPNPNSRIIFQNNNAGNFETCTINLNSGTLSVGGLALSITGGGPIPPSLNRVPTVNFNGGTLRAAGSTATFIIPQAPAAPGNTAGIAPATTFQGAAPVNFSVLTNGGAFDPAGFDVTVSASVTHGSGAVLDGGFSLNDTSGGATGILRLTGAGGTVNGGVIVTRGTLVAGVDAVAANVLSGTTNQTTAITGLSSTTGLAFGQSVSGGGVPAGTVITAITSATAITLSNATTVPAGAASLTFAPTSPLGTTLTMNGGNFSNITGTRDLSAATTLKVTAAGSTIDLGGAGTLLLADSALTHWANNSALTINSPTGGHIFVGSGQTLNYNQLSKITFAGSAQGAVQLATGEVVAGTPTGTFELLGNVDHNTATDAGDIGALAAALSNVDSYTNNLTLDSGWSSKAAEAIYLADVRNDDRINNLDLQGLIVYLANGGNGSNAPGGGSLAAVPEPSTFMLLALGGLVVCRVGFRRLRGRVDA